MSSPIVSVQTLPSPARAAGTQVTGLKFEKKSCSPTKEGGSEHLRSINLSDFCSSNSSNYYIQQSILLERRDRLQREEMHRLFESKLAEKNRKKEALESADIRFKSEPNADDVIISALRLEEEWKRDRRYSSKDIAKVSKLAKSEIFLRLNEGRSDPSPRIAEFMNKRRTHHKFFKLLFPSSVFPTHSKKVYDSLVRQRLEIAESLQHGIETSGSVERNDNYECPISFVTMKDPVYILNDGTPYRFEREAITAWLNQNGTHPFTRVEARVDDLVSDTRLEQEIRQFVQASEIATFVISSKNERV